MPQDIRFNPVTFIHLKNTFAHLDKNLNAGFEDFIKSLKENFPDKDLLEFNNKLAYATDSEDDEILFRIELNNSNVIYEWGYNSLDLDYKLLEPKRRLDIIEQLANGEYTLTEY
jgi:hypothetical protein